MTKVTKPDAYTQVGQLGKTKGLEGGLRFYPLGEAERLAIFEVDEVYVPAVGTLAIREISSTGAHLVLFFHGLRRLEKARALVNQAVFVATSDMPEQAGYYLDDLLELPVWLGSEHLGDVNEVVEAGTQVLLRVGEHLLPLEAPYVVVFEDHIELQDPPEGLLELAQALS